MKRIGLIITIGLTLAISAITPNKAKAQSSAVKYPFALVDSAMYALKPYYNSVSQGYMQPDSAMLTNGYSIYNYPVWDTVRFARQRSLLIMINNTQPLASIQLNIHKYSTGTVNACKAYLEGSDDGVNWVRLNDTLTTTNVTMTSHIWIVPSPISPGTTSGTTSSTNYNDFKYEAMPYLYYHVLFVGVSTSKVDLKAFCVPRHKSVSAN